jgi:hypothetical protein
MKKKKIEPLNIQPNDYLDDALDGILGVLKPFCEKFLNDEYWELCHDMAMELYDFEILSNKGKPQSWASGIVHALGKVNFLSDPSFSPYMESSQIADAFGVSQGTMQSKSKLIRDELDIIPMDPYWCLDSLLIDNPLVWMFEVNGFMMDIRNAPREVQEQAYEDELIPFIPADFQKKKKLQGKTENNIKIIEFPSGKNNKNKPEPIPEQKDKGPTLFDKLRD